MLGIKRARLTAQLPPTPVTPEMMGAIRRVAAQEKMSIAEVQRTAYSLFLETFYSKAIEECSKPIETTKGGDDSDKKADT